MATTEPRNSGLIGLCSTILLVGLMALVVVSGCSGPGRPARLAILITGDSRGYLEPCGCRRDQAGGLPVRATLLRRSLSQNPLIFDVGNIASGSRSYALIKLHYLETGMHLLHYDGTNIGQTDADLDIVSLKSEIADQSLPFVSANVFDRRSETLVAPPFRIITRGALRIGVTGVVGDGNAASESYGRDVEVKPPVESLAPVIAELKPRCDYLVVLSWSNQETIDRIAQQYPEIDAVFGGNVPQSSDTAQTLNRAVDFNVVNQGKVIGQVDLTDTGGHGYLLADSQGIKVTTTGIAPSMDMLDLIKQYKDELRDRRYELVSDEGMTSIRPQSDLADRFVGDAVCKSCHLQAYSVCQTTKHSAAFATLIQRNSDFDPECLTCHTVGYGLYSGFVDAQTTPQLENVQCESCHGQGAEHVEAMQSKLLGHSSAAVNALRAVTSATCIRCHDKENSENFNYATFWPKIAH